MTKNARVAVIAVGGNSLILDASRNGIEDQFQAAVMTAHHVVDMVEAGWNVVITHGNGPQVGFALRRSELALAELPPVPIDYAGADTQGTIGYMFQRAMHNELRRRGIDRRAIAVITQVLVDSSDPAFSHPAKPIGSYMDAHTAAAHAEEFGWQIREDAGRGWRRVVASPRPLHIVDLPAIEQLVDSQFIVIACGGGGIPVVERDGDLVGVEAVIDKDMASSLLARELGAELFVISTEVEKVALHFRQPNQRWLDRMTVGEARAYTTEGHFAEGSMKPKVLAMLEFLAHTAGHGVITNPASIGRALAGHTGTHIVRD